MKNSFKSAVFLVILSQLPNCCEAQQTLNVSGHSAKIDGMTFDYSIGEMTLVSTERASNLIVTQGVLQPGSSSTSSPSSDATLTIVDNPIKVYPNPASHLLFVEMYETAIQDYAYNLIRCKW
jgi:phosphopantothenate synthetase